MDSNYPTRSRASRAADGIRMFFKKIRGWFQSAPTRSSKPKPVSSGASVLDKDEHYEEYLARIGKMDDIAVKSGLHERLSASHKYMYEMGRRDGSLGVKLAHLSGTALATARETFGHIRVMLKGKLAALKAELEAVNRERDNMETLFQREQAYYNYVTFQYRFFPRSYSFILFILYLVIAIALILADIPLSVTLIKEGFDLQGGTGELDFPYLFKEGMFWKIIAANWEIVGTAVGIALCTIYFKIYYDEFVGTPYANRVMTYNRFLSENGFVNVTNAGQHIKNEHRIKAGIKTILVLFTLLGVLSLALFRLHTVAGENHLFDNIYCRLAFIAIALLFPVIGGICLSYALNNIQNLTRMWMAKRKCEKSRREWLRATKASTIVEKNHNDLLAATEYAGDEHNLDEYKLQLIDIFHRGYAIGAMQPDKYIRGEDFFNKVLEWRNIAISRNISTHIGNLN